MEPIKVTHFERASAPELMHDAKSGKYALRLLYYSKRKSNHKGLLKRSKDYPDEASAIADMMAFRVKMEIEPRSNRDKKRQWVGDINGTYNDIAANCTSLSSPDVQQYKRVNQNLSQKAGYSRHEWIQLGGDNETKLNIIARAIRRANYCRRKKQGISIGYYQSKLRDKDCANKLHFYRFERLPQLCNETKMLKTKLAELREYLESNSQHRIIIPNDLEIQVDNEFELDLPVEETDHRDDDIRDHYDDADGRPGLHPSPVDRQLPESFSIYQLQKARCQCMTIYNFLMCLIPGKGSACGTFLAFAVLRL